MGTGQKADSEMVALLVARDRATFERLFPNHNAAMVRFATLPVRSRATAEELAQDTRVAALNTFGGLEGRSSLASWIFPILLNKTRTRAKCDGRAIPFDGGGAEDNPAAAVDGHGRWKEMPELWDELIPERVIAERRMRMLLHRARLAIFEPPQLCWRPISPFHATISSVFKFA